MAIDTSSPVTTNAAALERCVAAVLSTYDISPDLQGVIARLPREPGPLTFADIPPLFKKLDLQVEKIALSFEAIRNTKRPAILVLRDGSYAAYLPTLSADEEFFVPGQNVTAADLHAIGLQAVFSIHPPLAKTNLATGHMRWGHRLDWFWQPVLDFWQQYAEILVCSVFLNLFVLALPLFSMNIYDRVASNFSQSTLVVLTVGIIIALTFDFILRSLRVYVLEHVAGKVGAKFDMDLMDRLVSVKATAMNLSLGERTNLFRELQGIKDFYASRLAPSLIDIPFFFLFVGVVYYLSPGVAMVPITAAIAIFLINFALQIPVKRSTQKYFSVLQEKSSVLVQTLAGMETIKMLGATSGKLFQWRVISSSAIEASRENNTLTAIASNMCLMVTYMVNVFVLFIGVYEISEGQMTVGGLVACTTLAGRAIAPIVGVSGLVSKLKQSSDVLKTIDKIFQLPHEDNNVAQISAKGPFKGKIQLQNVSFQYRDQPRPALNNVSLLINPGERIGLIGKTGAGKSTLTKVICHFLDPQSGNIFLDDYPLDTISTEELRRTIGYVPQESFFFSGSIRHNILLGHEHTDPAELQKIVEISGLEAILQSSGMSLDNEVGEGGTRLSGGQKQAIALARALVRNPSILVFDEPINGVDSTLEITIKQHLLEYLKDRTFIMITHRTSLLSLVNRLVLVDRGQIAADGPTDEIMRKLGGRQD